MNKENAIMSDDEFARMIHQKYNDFYLEQIEVFFTRATELANSDKLKEAEEIGLFALDLMKYSNNIGYETLYIFGFLCQLYADLDDYKMAQIYFDAGMKLIDKRDPDFSTDMDNFLDLKIVIEKGLKEQEVQS